MNYKHFIRLAVFLLLFTNLSMAQVPNRFFYQGYLTKTDGTPISDKIDMVIKIFDAANEGNAVWQESVNNVEVEEGYFVITLGVTSPLYPAHFDKQIRFLELTIKGEILSPRQRLLSTPYAHTAGQVIGNSNIFSNDGNVGIGTNEPQNKLDVVGKISSTNGGVFGTHETNGIGVYGASHGESGNGVMGSAPGSGGRGVLGYASNGGDVTNYGGHFVANGSKGVGVWAKGGKNGYAGDFRGNVRLSNWETGTTIMELGEGLDYAEGFDVTNKGNIAPGSILIIDSENPGKLVISNKAYDSRVAGIVAGANNLGSGVRLGADQFDFDVALAGRVYCNVDASEYEVKPGDLLTTSTVPGYAMKVIDHDQARGAVIGKAMERLAQGQKGQILVLVTLQ